MSTYKVLADGVSKDGTYKVELRNYPTILRIVKVWQISDAYPRRNEGIAEGHDFYKMLRRFGQEVRERKLQPDRTPIPWED